MEVINKDSLKIISMTGLLYGHRTVNELPSMSDRKGDLQNFAIYVMAADGGNERRLTDHLVYDGSPSWSPDSRRIAFVSDRDGNYEIYVMDADGGNQRNITKHDSWDLSPAWYTPVLAVAPAGKTLTMWSWLKQVD